MIHIVARHIDQWGTVAPEDSEDLLRLWGDMIEELESEGWRVTYPVPLPEMLRILLLKHEGYPATELARRLISKIRIYGTIEKRQI